MVLFFYPKDNTSICTKEACGFQNRQEEFRKRGAQVFGISRDAVESHRGFATFLGLTYPLLSDPDGATARSYGVGRFLGLLPGRATFVIDAQGRVLLAFSSAFQAEAHVRKALEALR